MSNKKHKCPEFENHERWLVSYADMVTLLFAVFVVLYALKDDGEKAQDVAGSLQESFSKPMEDIPLAHRVGPNEKGFGIFDHMRGNAIRPPITKKFPGVKDSVKIIDEEANKVRMQIEERLYGPQKFRKTDPGTARIVSIQREADGFRVRLLARYFYESGAIKVKESSRPDLDKVIKILKDLGRPLAVEGHTDAVPSEKLSNWQLSALRATSVVQYMITNHMFPPSLLSSAGYADTRPLASNNTESGRSMNRRLEFKVKYDTEMPQE